MEHANERSWNLRMSRTIKRLAAALGIACLLALIAILARNSAPAIDDASGTPVRAVSVGRVGIAHASPIGSPASAVSRTTGLADDRPIWVLRRAASSDNPYATAVASRDRGGPGGFAVTALLATMCQDAMGAVADFRDPRAQAAMAPYLNSRPDPSHASARMAMAAQRLETRCSQFQNNADLEHAKANDPDGKRFEASQAELTDFRKAPLSALGEMAGQGVLVSAAPTLRHWTRFDGVNFQGEQSREVFGHAVMLAEFLASSDPGNRADDTRVLAGCLQTAFCDGTYESIVLRKWPVGSPQRQAAIALAEKMAIAFQDNDASRFLGR